MKKFLLCIFCFLPIPLHADLDIYLSSDKAISYHPERWTSDIIEEETKIYLWYRYSREDFPLSYLVSSSELRSRIAVILSDLSSEERQNYYNALLEFDSDRFLDYIAIALSSDIDEGIVFKQNQGRELSPFEEIFLSCNISLASRRDIVRELIEDIYNDVFTSVDDIEYSTIEFWDCIIPFPDNRRTNEDIEDMTNTFNSNTYIAETLIDAEKFLQFPDKESDVTILWLSESWFINIEESLVIDSDRLEWELDVEKSHGKKRIAYTHKNHYINPFRNAIIEENEVWWYRYNNIDTDPISRSVFWVWHPLYISSSASEEDRVILPWTEIRTGVYKKTLLQQNTYTNSGAPRQQVWATSYYAILYNHDITPPYCEATRFSHDSSGDNTFQPEGDVWYNSYKYGFFVCWDPESWCRCDSSVEWCFIRDGWVISSPQTIPHLWLVSYEFINHAGNSITCDSSEFEHIRYDLWSPDIIIKNSGSPITWLSREYVTNEWVKYDGTEITSYRYFSFREIHNYEVGELENITFELYDVDMSDINQWLSWLESYDISVYRSIGPIWEKLWEVSSTDLGGVTNQEVWLLDINNNIHTADIQNNVWHYQIIIQSSDRAQNKLRAIWQYVIQPWEIDVWRSIISVAERWSLKANNEETYEYQIQFNDSFSNPIPWVEVTSIIQSCESTNPDCKVIRHDMSWEYPVGETALIMDILHWWVSDYWGRLYFELSSITPWEFTERFEITTSLWDTYTFMWENNSFRKPVTWTLETYNDGEWYDDRIFIWDERQYRVRFDIDSLEIDIDTSFGIVLTDSPEKIIQARHPDTWFSLSWSVIETTNGFDFTGTFSSSLWELENHKNLLEIIDENWGSWIVVTYNLWWYTIKYKLSHSNINDTPISLFDSRSLDNPLRLIWGLQGTWNHHNPSERQNFSDLVVNLQRTQMRKSIHQYIRWLESWIDTGEIRYIDMTHESTKNYIPDPEPDYETLIVRNWNILINSDFNTAWKSIWLISYIDNGYTVENWYNLTWNIYITPSVSNINAFIYADGWLVSVTESGEIFTNISQRDQQLTQQLRILGTLFTRNTVAWARELWWTYILPGSRQTDNQDIATQYDFYYLRRWNDWCDKDAYDFCIIPQYFIIEHDNRIYNSPPPLFSTR